MSEYNILNPVKGYDPQLRDSMNPNQGWQRTRPTTLAMSKPAFGRPWTRETSNEGHIYTLNYTRRNLAVTERLKQFFEQFEDGFFTLRDYDNGRDYVGRFVGEMPQSFEVNGRWTSSGWKFQEIPGCPMLQYPDQWERWAVAHRPYNDFGDPRLAVSSANWARAAAVVDELGNNVQPNQLVNLAPAAGDWCTFEYRGYGFRLWAVQGPAFGNVNLVVDGVQIGQVTCNAGEMLGPQIIYENASMPLDVHRVQIVMLNAAGAGVETGIVLDHFEVMR